MSLQIQMEKCMYEAAMAACMVVVAALRMRNVEMMRISLARLSNVQAKERRKMTLRPYSYLNGYLSCLITEMSSA